MVLAFHFNFCDNLLQFQQQWYPGTYNKCCKFNQEPCPFQIELGGMCNKNLRNRNKHHTLGIAQCTLSNQHNPCSCARSGEKGFDFLRFGEENFCLFASMMLLLVSKEGDVCTFFREDCTRKPGNVEFGWIPAAEVTDLAPHVILLWLLRQCS